MFLAPLLANRSSNSTVTPTLWRTACNYGTVCLHDGRGRNLLVNLSAKSSTGMETVSRFATVLEKTVFEIWLSVQRVSMVRAEFRFPRLS